MTPDLLKRTDEAILCLRNGLDDDEGDPYIDDTEERMEARRMEARRVEARETSEDWDPAIRICIADGCDFVTVANNEGDPMWGVAHSIAGAGKLIHDLKAALLATEAERDALLPPAHILALAERLRTQDNACTDKPMFCVQRQVLVGGLDAALGESRMFVIDGSAMPRSSWPKIAEALNRGGEEVTINEEVYRLATMEEYGYKIEWETVMVALTRQGCEEYLANNAHNLRRDGEPRIYVESFHRCPEMVHLREWLMTLGAVTP